MRRVWWAFLLGGLTLAACASFGSSGSGAGNTADEPDSSTSSHPVDAGHDAIATETNNSTDGSVPFTDAEVVDAAMTTLDAGVFALPPQKVDDFERADLPNGGPLNLTIVPSDDPYWRTDGCNEDTKPLGACNGTTVRLMNDGTNGEGGGTYMTAPLNDADRQIRWDFDYELFGDNGQPTVNQVQVASIQLSNNCYVFIETKQGILFLGDQWLKDPNKNTFVSEEIKLGNLAAGWQHYELYVDPVGGSETIAMGSPPVLTITTKTMQPQVKGTTFAAARIGITYQGGDSSINEVYDNIGLSEFQ